MSSRPFTERRVSASTAAAAVLRRSPDLSPTASPGRSNRSGSGRLLPPPRGNNLPSRQLLPVYMQSQAYKAWSIEDSPTPSMRSSAFSSPRLTAEPSPAGARAGGFNDEESAGLSSVRFAYGAHVHSLLLSADLSPIECQNILKAVFRLDESVIGIYEPKRAIVFPFSLVCRSPQSFAEEVYFLVLDQSGVQQPHLLAGAEKSPETSPQMSATSSPESTPQRINTRQILQQRAQQQQQQPQPRASGRAVNAAFQKAQQLARVAAASPTASSSEAEQSENDAGSLNGDEELSSDIEQSEVDSAEEDAAFEAAVERAVQAANQAHQKNQKLQAKQQSGGTKQNGRPQQQQQPPVKSLRQGSAQVALEAALSDRSLEERLLRELGDYDDNDDEDRGDYDDGGMDATSRRGRGVESAGAEAVRQEFWLKQREAVMLEAERRSLAESQAKLAQQRKEIDALRAEQARLYARREEALAAVNAHQERADAQLLQKARSSKDAASTALKGALKGRPNGATRETYETFASEEEDEEGDEGKEDEDEEIDQSDEGGSDELDQSEGQQSEDGLDENELPEPYEYEQSSSNISNNLSTAPSSSFILSAKELIELEELQTRTGFASISPATLFALFQSKIDSETQLLSRSRFDEAARKYVSLARIEDEGSQRKAILVLNRLFDLFDEQSNGTVEYAQFATGLTIIVQGDKEEKLKRD
jgi:hypothetical protein